MINSPNITAQFTYIFVQNQVTILHLYVRFGNERFNSRMSAQKFLKNLVRYVEPFGVPQSIRPRIFTVQQQTLEYFPPKKPHTSILPDARLKRFEYLTGFKSTISPTMSSKWLYVFTTVLILKSTLYCSHQSRILFSWSMWLLPPWLRPIAYAKHHFVNVQHCN